ncbi:hypothetical protein [Flagellimonas pelagia]|uniref:YkuD domain-containing protein n=1 Tax=Flagellimonas pelagia TaxID=2306998 RepID=A0A3A1NML6_9FLAO|nr:hypothetical protein [Allomuricauda maritima]RIV47531.1 hypothetical protein D2V05_00060 [Allomuricauda maritima]TXK01620.1 hypothetical protein FQ017_00055 [Allomuricauda maritima]
MGLVFLIKSIKSDLAEGYLIWPEMGLESQAISGPYGKGELPNGIYNVPRSGLMNKYGKKGFCDLSGNCWFQYIEPQFITDRTELGIHPDGNVPGTLGCIGLLDSDTNSWLEAFKSLPNGHIESLEVVEHYT